MRDIHETLRQKEVQLKQLQAEVDALRLAAHLLAEDGEDATEAKTGIVSQPQMVKAVLLEAGHPLHVTEIVAAIKKKFGRKLKQPHLTALLYRYKKNGKLFYKDDRRPNTFGLLEWQAKTPMLARIGG